MEVDRHVVGPRTQTPEKGELRANARQAAPARGDDHFIDVRVVRDDGGGGRLDDIREVRGREALADGADGWRREHDVTNLAESDEEDPHWVIG